MLNAHSGSFSHPNPTFTFTHVWKVKFLYTALVHLETIENNTGGNWILPLYYFQNPWKSFSCSYLLHTNSTIVCEAIDLLLLQLTEKVTTESLVNELQPSRLKVTTA